MASLLPLIQDILPMILPSSIHITKASEILPPSVLTSEATGTDAVEGHAEPRVVSRDAIVNKTDKMCATGQSTSENRKKCATYTNEHPQSS
jgi:hypothetical protein